MDSTSSRSNTINPSLTLTPKQEELLFTALNSNKAPNGDTYSKPTTAFPMAPAAFLESPSPIEQIPASGTLGAFEESPFVDYDYGDFGDADGSFDFDYGLSNDSQGQMIGDLPSTSSNGDADVHDKRGHPDEESGEDEEGGGKRREGSTDEKTSKKPGRKPLTSEPTSVSDLERY